jgi:hypothetical protein
MKLLYSIILPNMIFDNHIIQVLQVMLLVELLIIIK